MKNIHYSHRNFTEIIKGRVTGVNGIEIVFWPKYGIGDRSRAFGRIRFTSGTLSGQDFRITENTTVSATLENLSLGVSVNDTIEIYWDLLKIPASQFNDTEIFGSNFYIAGQKKVDILPADIIGVTLTDCNLDNAKSHAGCTFNKGTNKAIHKQNDGLIWEVDGESPIKCMEEARLIELGLSTDPLDIPVSLLAEDVITKKEKELGLI